MCIRVSKNFKGQNKRASNHILQWFTHIRGGKLGIEYKRKGNSGHFLG